MRIVALHAVGGGERLSLVSLDQGRVFGVMAIQAERRRGLRQVVIELLLAAFTGLVGEVAGFAAHVEGSVAAALLGNVQSLGMAAEAEVLVLVAGGCLQQLELVVGLVRIMTLHAIANCGRMNLAFEVGGIVIGVAGQAERLRGGGNQLNTR